MNNQKYPLYLVLLVIFCTFSQGIAQISPLINQVSQKSTVIKKTSPKKKSLPTNTQSKRNSHNTKNRFKSMKCPNSNIPAGLLTATELKEVLICTQAQEKNSQKIKEHKEKRSTQKIKRGPLNDFLEAPHCPYSNTPLKKLKIEQLNEVYDYTEKNKMDSAFMIELLERLIALSDNHAGVKKYKLQLADTHYQAHHIEKAAGYYEDFAILYPGSNENEYVLYKAVACMFELSLDADRDQTNSKKTIALVKEFLKRAKNPELIQESKNILQKCYDRLYDHEVYVLKFYIRKKNFIAAQMRLDYIGKTFAETIHDITKKIEDLKNQIELAKNPEKPAKTNSMKKLLA